MNTNKNYNKKSNLHIRTISLTLCFALIFTFTVNASSVSDLEKQKKENAAKASQIQSNINASNSKKTVVLEEIAVIDVQLNAATKVYDEAFENLQKTQDLLAKTKEELAAAQVKKENQYAALKERVKYMYVNGDMGYLEILLDSKDFTSLLNRVEYLNSIVKYDNELLENFKKTEDLINTKVEEVSSQEKEVAIQVKDADQKKKNIETVLAQKQSYIDEIDKDVNMFNSQIDELDAQSKSIENQISKMQAAAAAARNNSSSSRSSKSIPAPYSGGKLSWPLPGNTRISSGYGPRSSPISSKSEFHTGIDIPAPKGTPLHAAASGTVIYASYMNGYGNTVIIDHGGGLTTLYGHNSSLTCRVGDVVSNGEVIAKIGSTGYSTGNHVHFEVRVNGRHTSPIPYLS